MTAVRFSRARCLAFSGMIALALAFAYEWADRIILPGPFQFRYFLIHTTVALISCIALFLIARHFKECSMMALIVEDSQDGIIGKTLDGTIVFWNSGAEQIYGYTSAEVRGKCISILAPPGIPDELPGILGRIRRGERVKRFETTRMRKDGRVIPVSLTISPVRSRMGKITGASTVVRDITERKRTEDELRRAREELESRVQTSTEELCRSEEKYRELVENANSIIIRSDGEGRIAFFNEFARRFFGYTEEEVLGREWLGTIIPERESTGRDLVRMVSDILACPDEYTANENENMRKDGSRVWVAWNNRAMMDESGRVVQILSVGNDITERRKAKESLQQSERELRLLSSKLLSAQEDERKRIAGELHDSLGSSLAAVKIALETVKSRTASGLDGMQSLDAAIQWIQHSIVETRRIMADLRPSILDDLGLLSALGWTFNQYRSIHPEIHLEEEIVVKEEEIPEPLKITIFRITQEALHNIAKHSGAEFVEFCLVRRSGLELNIRDNGAGFDLEAVLSSPEGQRGLGLTSMRERAELSGGTFSLGSTAGEGTSIRVLWPV